MESDLTASTQELADDIIGVSYYAPETPQKKDFLPWHRPRKQFVREKQWCEQIKLMLKDISFEGNSVIKYLGLPGDDLLDLRYFHHQICEPQGIHLKYLGFNYNAHPNSKQSAELNISMDEVNKLPFVDPTSTIIGDDICQIANPNSLAYRSSMKMGPYDVINIDLCDGFAQHPNNKFKETHYQALTQLMTLQARRSNPWLLLLTTRTGSKHVNEDVYKILKDLYKNNLMTCEGFLEASTNSFSIKDAISLNQISKSETGHSYVFLISICKWISSILTGQNPPARMEVKSVQGYQVEPGVDFQDLVSIAVRIDPTLHVPEDKIGLATHFDLSINECQHAIQALKRVSKLVDVDGILEQSSEILNEMVDQSVRLLAEARYDTDGYREWLGVAI